MSDADIKAIDDVKDRLEFFFSDANIRQDRFIRKLLMDTNGEEKGRVPVVSLLKFNTIKRYTDKTEVVVMAAKALPDLLTLNESESSIGRKVAFTEEMMDGNIPKSLYIKDLPLKEKESGGKEYGCSVDEVKGLFKEYGDVVLVKMMWSGPRKQKQPDGCAMVEFSTQDGLEKAAAATLTLKDGAEVEAKDKLTMGESKIEVMLFSEYLEKKVEGNKSGNKRNRDDESEKEIRTFTFDWKPGCVIKIKGLPEGCNREAILDAVAKQLDISLTEVKNKKIYADFSIGQTDGALRFLEPDDNVKLMAERLKSGELEISGSKVQDAFLLEGDEEKKYYDDFIAFKNKQIRHHDENKRSRKKGRHGGRHRKN
eukprot:scaffold11809_cov128-Cylindrotheca_fusiformis.AAC.24